MQRSSEGLELLSRVQLLYLSRLQRNSVGIALACFEAGRGSILFSARHPMEVLIAERTSDEQNQKMPKCRGKG